MIEEKTLKIYKNISTAILKFNKYGFTYTMKDYLTGHFLVRNLDGKCYQYIAETEIILGRKEKGINDFIRILRGEL